MIAGLRASGQTVSVIEDPNPFSPCVCVGFDVTVNNIPFVRQTSGQYAGVVGSSVYVDGKIKNLSGNPILFQNSIGGTSIQKGLYIENVVTEGTTNLIQNNNDSVITAPSNMSRIRQYIFNKQHNVNPAAYVGARTFREHTIIDGVDTYDQKSRVSDIESLTSMPSVDYVAQHTNRSTKFYDPEDDALWDLTLFNPETTDVHTRINNALTSGKPNVLLGKGTWNVGQPVVVPAGVNFFGANGRWSVIQTKRDSFSSPTGFTIDTPDSANAVVSLANMCIFHQPTAEAGWNAGSVRWRCGKDSVMHMVSHKGSNSSYQTDPRSCLLVTGNGAGRLFGIEGGGRVESAVSEDTRTVMIQDKTNPAMLFIYGFNLETTKDGGVGGPIDEFSSEINNSVKVRIYSWKREGSSASTKIIDSDDIGIYGVGRLTPPFTPWEANNNHFLISGDCDKILIALAGTDFTVTQADLDKNSKILREEITGQSAFEINWPEGVALYLRGEPTINGDAAPTPEVNPGMFNYVGAGNLVSSVGAMTVVPPARSVGNLMLCGTAIWTITEGLNQPGGWRVMANENGLALLGKLAVDTGVTSASPDAIVGHDMWDGTSNARAQIAVFGGDIPASIDNIQVTVVPTNTTGSVANIPTTGATIADDNRLAISLGKKNKTISAAITLTPPSGIDNVIGQASGANSNTLFGWGFTIQTDAANLPSGAWTQNNAESAPSSSLTIILEPAVATAPDAPTGQSADNVDQTSMRVKCDDVTNALGYRLYKTAQGATTYAPPELHSEISQAQKDADGGFLVNSLLAGTTYKWKITAFNASGESSYSSELTQATSAAVDTEAPDYDGATSITYNESSRVFTIVHTQATDNVTAQENIRYSLAYSSGSIDYDAPRISLEAADSYDIPRDTLFGKAGGTLTIVLRAADEESNEDTNTVERTVSVPALPNVLVEACDNGSGSPKTGEVYAQFVLSGQAFNINVEDPAATCELITLDANGQYRFYADPGIYQWKYLDVSEYETSGDRDDIWTAEGWCEVEE